MALSRPEPRLWPHPARKSSKLATSCGHHHDHALLFLESLESEERFDVHVEVLNRFKDGQLREGAIDVFSWVPHGEPEVQGRLDQTELTPSHKCVIGAHASCPSDVCER